MRYLQPSHRPLPALFAAIGLAALALMLVASPARRVRADDGCDPSEQIACLPAPEESDDTPAASARVGQPSVALPPGLPLPIPRPCPPLLVPPMGGDVATPLPVPRGCTSPREIVATVNRGNVLYARALRSLDGADLPSVWSGEALAELRRQVATLRDAGLYATPQLQSIALRELRLDPGSATVRTLEHWLYQERYTFNGSVVTEQDQWVQNVYTLRQAGGWTIVKDVVTPAGGPLPPPPPPPPPPAPPASARVTTDRMVYGLGDSVHGAVTNDGAATLYVGGGYACGPLAIEWLGPDGWQKAPLPEPLIACTAIARALRPGESLQQTLPAGDRPGFYRLAFRYSSEGMGAGAAYSDPYLVQ